MSNSEDILAYAWSKNADSLKSAVDNYMSAKASEHIADMTADVAASMFSNSSDDELAQVDEPQSEQELETLDEPALEGSDNAE